MGDALIHVEAAIAEVTKAREAVMRKKSREVRAGDELDRLKAVALAWLKTHRFHMPGIDLTAVDRAYQKVLDATARRTTRTTYAHALNEAKHALVNVRRAVTTPPPESLVAEFPEASKAEPPPDFASLAADPAMQAILERRWEEVQLCITAGANLAATVMMGGLLETLLLARINRVSKKEPIFTAKKAPRDKAGKTLYLSDWKLVNMVEVAHELGWITRSAKDLGNVLRDSRNYIHPHKEHTDGVSITDEDVRLFWEVCKSISRHVLGSVGKSP